MRIKSKYKIARRFGADLFEKTQTQKFAVRAARKARSVKRPHGKSDYGKAMFEKQKVRFTYGINERQFSKYAKTSITKKKVKPEESLYRKLEMRLDNVVYKLGLGATRLSSRQIICHGHISLNGKRVSIPSFHVSAGDSISPIARSINTDIFSKVEERSKNFNIPRWLSFDPAKLTGKVISLPEWIPSETNFDLSAILDFYRR